MKKTTIQLKKHSRKHYGAEQETEIPAWWSKPEIFF